MCAAPPFRRYPVRPGTCPRIAAALKSAPPRPGLARVGRTDGSGTSTGDAFVANEAGKRVRCEECGAEVVVTKGGEGTVSCHGQPMQPK